MNSTANYISIRHSPAVSFELCRTRSPWLSSLVEIDNSNLLEKVKELFGVLQLYFDAIFEVIDDENHHPETK